jgi:hypothetical protein
VSGSDTRARTVDLHHCAGDRGRIAERGDRADKTVVVRIGDLDRLSMQVSGQPAAEASARGPRMLADLTPRPRPRLYVLSEGVADQTGCRMSRMQ